MRYNGENLLEVVEAHAEWLKSGGENDEDRADFSGADLRGICLAYVNLFAADFRNANLYMACLFRTNLENADLRGANLWMADLYSAKLRGAKGLPFIPQCVPDTGSFIAWKRVLNRDDREQSVIAKLLIPDDAQRLYLYNGEYRASKVKVLEIQDYEGNVLPGVTGISIKDGKTLYIPGETVSVENFNTNLYRNHVPGIYFYLERKAATYYLSNGYDTDGRPVPIDRAALTKMIEDSGGYATPVEVTVDDPGRERKDKV